MEFQEKVGIDFLEGKDIPTKNIYTKYWNEMEELERSFHLRTFQRTLFQRTKLGVKIHGRN